MKEEPAATRFEIHPDLMKAPHVLPLLMELFAGDRQQALSQQEQIYTHLAMCEYCRTAVIFLLSTAQEYDHRNNNEEEPIHDLLVRFPQINDAIEGYRYERLGAYVEMVVAKGQEQADLHFPDIAVHLKTCSDCCSLVKRAIASITETEGSE